MKNPMPVYHYLAFGLVVESQIALPLPPTTISRGPVGKLFIGFGTIPGMPDTMYRLASFYYGTVGEDLIVSLPALATFLVTDYSITITADEVMDRSLLARFLVSGILGVYMMKRGFLLLHGSAIVHRTHAICLIGDQRSGKSTTAAKLASLALPVLCDDLIPLVQQDAGEPPMVLSGIPRLKLLPDAYRKLVGDIDSASPLFDGVDKYQTTFREYVHPAKLGCICILSTPTGHTPVSIQKVTGMEKLSNVLVHASVMREIRLPVDFFSKLSAILSTIPVYRVTRPLGEDSLNEVANTILSID